MYSFYYDKDPSDTVIMVVLNTTLESTILYSSTLDSINNSLIYISNSLDIIYLNIVFFLFLVACALLCTKKKNKEYITLEPKITHGTITHGTITHGTVIPSTIKM
jgi:hypothetical protein